MKKFVKWRRETLLPNLEWRLPDYQYETNSWTLESACN
jgi:hypothetical protein